MEWKSTPAAIWAAALWYTLLGGFLAAFAFWQSLTAGIAFAAVWLLPAEDLDALCRALGL